jgi:AbiV family abortive infection protein
MGQSTERRIDFDEKIVATMAACLAHARDLLNSARAVQAAGHPNIAYHLAALVLEEIGRRELLGVQSVARLATIPPSWPSKHTQDHVKKLFWSFFGGGFFAEPITAKSLEEMTVLARRIHETRLLGLYVDHGDDGLSIPSEAIGKEETDRLIELADARLGMAEDVKLRERIPQGEIELQAWFLSATDDPTKRRQIMSEVSLAKLAELRDARVWARWLREQFDTAETEARAVAEQALRRSRNLPEKGSKDKWKLRVRILCASHSIRPKTLSAWNAKSDWIKLVPVSSKKNELIIEFILGENVPIEATWFFGWGLARHFVVALNIGTMGFWWWRMPEQISRYYESIEDLETHRELVVERNPSLKIDWGKNRVLTEQDLANVVSCFVSLPGPDRRDQHAAYNFYIGGLTFLSLNDIHWQCEGQAFGNFFECLRAMMEESGDWTRGTSFEPSFVRFLDDLFPNMDERDRLAEICHCFEADKLKGLVITLKEVAFIKLFCDAYFFAKIRPKAAYAKRLKHEGPPSGSDTDPA